MIPKKTLKKCLPCNGAVHNLTLAVRRKAKNSSGNREHKTKKLHQYYETWWKADIFKYPVLRTYRKFKNDFKKDNILLCKLYDVNLLNLNFNLLNSLPDISASILSVSKL